MRKIPLWRKALLLLNLLIRGRPKLCVRCAQVLVSNSTMLSGPRHCTLVFDDECEPCNRLKLIERSLNE